VIDDAGRFLDRWAAKAAALGWDTASVFGVHADMPIERFDCAGLVWLLSGNEIEAISPSVVRIRTRRGAVQIYDRRPQSASVPLWELRGALRPADRASCKELQQMPRGTLERTDRGDRLEDPGYEDPGAETWR
jgi:hypothetical protein